MTFAPDDFQQNLAQEEQSEQASAQSGRWYAVQVASGCEKRVKAKSGTTY
jgi:transcriptional antiterminator NusG